MSDPLDRIQAALADRYAIEAEIGEGGMATVYLAEDLKHGRRVAIKVFRPELATAIGPDRFLREIELAARLNHPHILALHDSGDADGLLYYVMPYVEGESLRDRLRREQQLSVDEALRITREVADGLSHAHEMGVVHRDIKPENILLASGHAVIADFGIARALEGTSDERLTQTGLSLGTPAYMSPEQAMGDQDVDARSDVYSLGCMAFEMLAGDPPFTGRNARAIMARKSLEEAPRIRTARRVPAWIEDAVRTALATVPADRFATMAEFREALAGPPSGGRGLHGPGGQVGSWRRVGTAALLTLAAVAGWWLFDSRRDPPMDSLVILPFYNAANDPEQAYFAAGMHEELINTLKHVGGLRVTSLTSALRYRDSEKPLDEIARELRVAGIVEAAVLRRGDSISVEVQLTDATDEPRQVWSQPFVRDIAGVLQLYNDVARSIAEVAGVRLEDDQRERLGEARVVRGDTYESYLRGMYLLRRGTYEDAQEGLRYLMQAIETDPADPLAYAGLALGLITAAHGPQPPHDALPRARAAAQRALALDSTLAETMTALAFLEGYYYNRWAEAEDMFERALAMKPGLDMGHYWYSWQLALFGRTEEAFEHHRRAEEIDPLNSLHTAGLGWLYLIEGDCETAEILAERALELTPQQGMGLYVLAECLSAEGNHEEAIEVARRAKPGGRGWILGRQLAHAGRVDEARAIAAELEAEGPSAWNAWSLSLLYSALDDHDNAFRWLDYERIHVWSKGLGLLPGYEPLRDDPRFDQILDRLGLPRPDAST